MNVTSAIFDPYSPPPYQQILKLIAASQMAESNEPSVDPVSPTVSNEEEITSEVTAPLISPEKTFPANINH